MNTLIRLTCAALAILAAGCVTITDKPARVTSMASLSGMPREFVLFGDMDYKDDLTIACAERGIRIRPITIRRNVTERESNTRTVNYDEPGLRYALNLAVRHHYDKVCYFSDGHVVDVSLSVIDIASNETVMIIRQKGPDRECPPVTPVWDLLAKELSNRL